MTTRLRPEIDAMIAAELDSVGDYLARKLYRLQSLASRANSEAIGAKLKELAELTGGIAALAHEFRPDDPPAAEDADHVARLDRLDRLYGGNGSGRNGTEIVAEAARRSEERAVELAKHLNDDGAWPFEPAVDLSKPAPIIPKIIPPADSQTTEAVDPTMGTKVGTVTVHTFDVYDSIEGGELLGTVEAPTRFDATLRAQAKWPGAKVVRIEGRCDEARATIGICDLHPPKRKKADSKTEPVDSEIAPIDSGSESVDSAPELFGIMIGDVIRTSYRSGPYRVVSISEVRTFFCGTCQKDHRIPKGGPRAFSMKCAALPPEKPGEYFLNGFCTVGGRHLAAREPCPKKGQLFGHAREPDELFVVPPDQVGPIRLYDVYDAAEGGELLGCFKEMSLEAAIDNAAGRWPDAPVRIVQERIEPPGQPSVKYDVYHTSAAEKKAPIGTVDTEQGPGSALGLARKKWRNLDKAGFEVVVAGQRRPSINGPKRSGRKPRADARTKEAPADGEQLRGTKYPLWVVVDPVAKLACYSIEAPDLETAEQYANSAGPARYARPFVAVDRVQSWGLAKIRVIEPSEEWKDGLGWDRPVVDHAETAPVATVFDDPHGWRTTPIAGLKLDEDIADALRDGGLMSAGSIADWLDGKRGLNPEVEGLYAVELAKTKERTKIKIAVDQVRLDFSRERAAQLVAKFERITPPPPDDQAAEPESGNIQNFDIPAEPAAGGLDLAKIGIGRGETPIPRAALRALAKFGIRLLPQLEAYLEFTPVEGRAAKLMEIDGILDSHPAKIFKALHDHHSRTGDIRRAVESADARRQRSLESRPADGEDDELEEQFGPHPGGDPWSRPLTDLCNFGMSHELCKLLVNVRSWTLVGIAERYLLDFTAKTLMIGRRQITAEEAAQIDDAMAAFRLWLPLEERKMARSWRPVSEDVVVQIDPMAAANRPKGGRRAVGSAAP